VLIGAVAKRLKRRYHDRRHFNRREPLAELVFIILSLQTAECRYLQTYKSLRTRFRTWSAVRRASTDEVAETIRDGGLAAQKAANIISMLAEIKRRTGRTSLEFLRRCGTQETEAFLCSLPGVGIKTARCVELYTLGRAVFPVDVHCWRIVRRMGLIRGTAEKPTRIEADLIQEMIPPRVRYSLHVNMISLGRDVCRPGRPLCELCCIQSYCEHGLRRARAVDSSVDGATSESSRLPSSGAKRKSQEVLMVSTKRVFLDRSPGVS